MSDPSAWGIEAGYTDVHGRWHESPPATVDAILRAMGADGRPEPPGTGASAPVRVTRPDGRSALEGRWELRTEDGATAEVEGRLPPLPLGYHTLTALDGGRVVRLVASPGLCHPAALGRAWGWAVQLYALRSAGSWGMGDLEDLRRLGRLAASQGAAVCLLNPLHASWPGLPQEPSPYSPSSRCFRNPLYLRVEGDGGEGLNHSARIDRDGAWKAKMVALERLFEDCTDSEGSGDSSGLARYRAEMGPALEGYATFCALSEVLGRPWTSWPEAVRRPDGPGVAAFAAEHARRVDFHAWLQWQLDGQLAAAGAGVDLVHDLAIGVDPAGADAWWWQDAFALGVRVGAPPDEFNTAGQDWGLPPFDPWRLGQAGYEPFIQTVRAGLRHAGGIRIDHVMGLFRLFWIPEGGGPADGAYVRYPWADLLDILALESVRAGAFVVGEDLGTVEPEVRAELAARNVLSYRLVWFEEGPPSRYPAQAMAAVTTHDLPTVAGVWRRTDQGEGVDELRSRLKGLVGLDDDAGVGEVVAAAHSRLAEAASTLVVATLEDALEVEQRPNRPGTLDPANWSTPLPLTLEEIEVDPRVAAVAEALDRRRTADPGPGAAPGGT